MANDVKTYKDIQDAIIRRGKIEDTTENRTAIKEYINTLYQEIAREEAYRWSGDTMPIRLRGKYSTGTITATNGSDEVTGDGTTWVENDHRFSKMRISGQNAVFKILRVGSTTTATLNQYFVGTTASSLSYTIYRDEYGLFPDCQDVRQLHIPGINETRQPKPIGIGDLDYLRNKSPFREGTPLFYTVFGRNIYTEKTWATFNLNTDYWEDSLDSTENNLNLIVWPGILTSDRVALVRYTRTPFPLVLDSDEPWIPYEDRSVLVWGVLSERFLVNRDISTKREWEGKYKERKNKMASDIETTDDKLILTVDRSRYSRMAYFPSINEDRIS